MAYNTDELFELCIKTAKEKTPDSIRELLLDLPCHKSTFYEHFPNDSDHYKRIVEEIDKNKIKKKSLLKKRWFDSDNATLQVALMKLLADEEEAHRLNGTKTENRNENNTIVRVIELGEGTKPNETITETE